MKTWQLVLAAACGGMCLSISELMGMVTNKEVIDGYFFLGMLIAGVLGIGGFFAVGANSIRTAFVAGVSAPQILAGLTKAVPAGAKALGGVVLSSIAFAQAPVASVNDTINVLLLVDGIDSVQINSSKGITTVGDSSNLSLIFGDTVMVRGTGISTATFVADTGVKAVRIKVYSSFKESLMRGLFAQQATKSERQKVSVEIIRSTIGD